MTMMSQISVFEQINPIPNWSSFGSSYC